MAVDLQSVLAVMLSGSKWPTDGGHLVVTYSFLRSVPEYYELLPLESRPEGFDPFNSDQELATSLAMAYWSYVANIEFVPAGEGQIGQITFGNKTNFNEPEIAGVAYLPDGSQFGGDVWINRNDPHWNAGTPNGNANPTPGKDGFWVLVHEIGHALGLDHPPVDMFYSLMNGGYGVYAYNETWRPDRFDDQAFRLTHST